MAFWEEDQSVTTVRRVRVAFKCDICGRRIDAQYKSNMEDPVCPIGAMTIQVDGEYGGFIDGSYKALVCRGCCSAAERMSAVIETLFKRARHEE